MLRIRPFRNPDLPHLFDIWMGHWNAARQTPAVSVNAIERAIVSRMFFRPECLLVATLDEHPVAWCHHQIEGDDSLETTRSSTATSSTATSTTAASTTASIAAICFAGEAGLQACDALLHETERSLRARGVTNITAGPLRDQTLGYAGLSPIGHGIGVPVADSRTASLLSRHGYSVARSVQRWTASTSTYRAPVNRDFLQLRRSTRIDHWDILPTEPHTASAMCHLDLQRHVLFNYTSRTIAATVDLWLSDAEMHVMDGGRSILSLDLTHPVAFVGQTDPTGADTSSAIDADQPVHRTLSVEEQFLITSLIPTLATQNIYSIEIAIDDGSSVLMEQFKTMKFNPTEQGRSWKKEM